MYFFFVSFLRLFSSRLVWLFDYDCVIVALSPGYDCIIAAEEFFLANESSRLWWRDDIWKRYGCLYTFSYTSVTFFCVEPYSLVLIFSRLIPVQSDQLRGSDMISLGSLSSRSDKL